MVMVGQSVKQAISCLYVPSCTLVARDLQIHNEPLSMAAMRGRAVCSPVAVVIFGGAFIVHWMAERVGRLFRLMGVVGRWLRCVVRVARLEMISDVIEPGHKMATQVNRHCVNGVHLAKGWALQQSHWPSVSRKSQLRFYQLHVLY